MAGDDHPKWGDKLAVWGRIGVYYGLPYASYLTNPPDLNKKGIVHTMKLPPDLNALESLGYKAADGALKLGSTIPLKTNTQPYILVDAKALADARQAYDTTTEQVARGYAALKQARDVARQWLMSAKALLTPTLGKKWTSAWSTAGWENQSLAVPASEDDLLPMLRAQANYLTAHPELAVSDARYNYTAAQATALSDAIKLALSNADSSTGKPLGIEQAEHAQADAKQVRDLTEAALRRRLHWLYSELEQALPAGSNAWGEFGFEAPDAQHVPDPVTALTATPIGGGRVHLEWPAALRTDHYQLWSKKAGDADFALVDSITGATEYYLDGQSAGAVLTLKVRGVNTAGTGQYTPDITVTVT